MDAGPAGLATPPELAGHPALRRAERLAADVLVPAAQRVDVDGLPASHLAAARAAGLVGLAAPAPVLRAVTEILSGACGTTWFVLTQHGLPLATVEGCTDQAVRDRWLPRLRAGELLAGVAVAHLRRPGPPAVAVTPTAAGWRLDGSVGWFTGWGLVDVFLLGAQHGDDLLFFLLDAVEGPDLRPGGDLPLAAMGGTHTTSLHLDGLEVGAGRLVERVRRERWLAADTARTANATPAVFGLLRAVVRELAATGQRRSSAEATALAGSLDSEGGAVRTAAYRLLDDFPADQALDQRLRLRAAACELAVRASAALVAAQAGAAMLRSAPAQRWAREALFHQVQAQTVDLRAAQLRRYAQVHPGR